jgi:hypothetical protein
MPIVAASCLLKVKPNAERPTPFTLLARVGGMYARFGLLQENGQITDAHRLFVQGLSRHGRGGGGVLSPYRADQPARQCGVCGVGTRTRRFHSADYPALVVFGL